MTLVLLHPVGLDRDTWQYLDADVVEGAVRYDLLWHGDRPKPEGALTLAAMADDVVASVPGPLDVLGLSMGGAVVQQIALRHPGRVRSAVIACSSPGGTGGTVQEERARAIEEGGIESILDVTLERWFSDDFLTDPDRPAIRYTRERLLADDPAAFAASWRALAANDTLAQLPTLKMPVTVIHAEGDKAARTEVQEAMAAALPVGRLDVIPGPHMVQMELLGRVQPGHPRPPRLGGHRLGRSIRMSHARTAIVGIGTTEHGEIPGQTGDEIAVRAAAAAIADARGIGQVGDRRVGHLQATARRRAHRRRRGPRAAAGY